MSNDGFTKRLSAVLAADVAGYTRLMENDSEGTVAAWQNARSDVIDPTVNHHEGRIVKHTGDGFLVEFSTVQAAVECAVALQNGLADCPLAFRMGVNLGDVFDDGEDIHGEGVNIAARIEALAEEGGICISGDVYNQVRNRLDYQFKDTGEHEVKHVSAPVRVFSIVMDDTRPSPATAVSPAVPQKPSIAVLPFDNMSNDPEQEYFSDGIAEDLITALSRFHQFFVSARNSSFSYKANAVDMKQVAHELGVQYVIEGSVRRAKDRVRITAQLIDATNDHHIWAERYDRELDDIFAVQDDITQHIVMAVAPELNAMEMLNAQQKELVTLGVWELVARANWHAGKFTKQDNEEAIALLLKGNEVDPKNARIHASLSFLYAIDGLNDWTRPQQESRDMALKMAAKAVELDKDDEYGHTQWGVSLYLSKQHGEAIRRFRTAIKLNPNYSIAIGNLGISLVYVHQHSEGVDCLLKAMQLSPKDPMLILYIVHIGIHHFIEERYDEALVWAEKAVHENPRFPNANRLLAAVNGALENLTDARAALDRLSRISPGITIEATRRQVPWAFEEDANRYSEALRRAGMPEK